MKSAATLALLCILGVSGCTHSHQASAARDHAAVMNSLPAAVATLPVRIVPSFEHRVLAWSTAGMMEEYVAYNPRVSKRVPPEVLAFALVHEYGHLQLHHISFLGVGNGAPATIKERELAADRFAVRFWATNDTSVARAAAESFMSPTASRVLGSEIPSDASGYPTRRERAQAILDCLAEMQQTSEVEDQ